MTMVMVPWPYLIVKLLGENDNPFSPAAGVFDDISVFLIDMGGYGDCFVLKFCGNLPIKYKRCRFYFTDHLPLAVCINFSPKLDFIGLIDIINVKLKLERAPSYDLSRGWRNYSSAH